MPRKAPKIILLHGHKSPIHLEAPHATQASDEEFAEMLKFCIKSSKKVKRGRVFANHLAMSLMWRCNRVRFKRGGLIFIRSLENTLFECHPEDRAALERIVLNKLKHSFDDGTLRLVEDLSDDLNLPALIDGQHRYVGGDLNRSPGTPCVFNKGNNTAKCEAWNAAEYEILDKATEGAHVVIALHSMDKRPHRRFFNEKTGQYEFDREIIIGTRFASSVDPAILENFFFAFESALEDQFKGQRVPRVKLDLEFIGDKVLKERRQNHLNEGRDVHYIQIEFMKYLLEGEAYTKILNTLKEATARLEHLMLQNNLEVPRKREHYNTEYTNWSERINATQWKFQADVEEAMEGEEEPFIRLSSTQREYLHVDLLDYIEDAQGRKWLVKAQLLEKARAYTEEDRVTLHGREATAIVLLRK